MMALQQTASALPIVLAQVADPVANGLVASLARPGGNVTGFALWEYGFAANCQLTAQRTGILLDDGEQHQRVAIVWHSPLPWIAKPAFVCPVCNLDCYGLHEKAGVFACRKCHGMSYASRHLYRTVPSVHRVARLRRKIGADPRPFTPLSRRPRHHIRFHRVVARILFDERALLGHLQTVTHDLERRISVRKAKGKW